jgi:hypothetical protein
MVQTVFLELLRISMWGGVAHELDGFKDWRKVFALAEKQSVMALVVNAVLCDHGLGEV